MIPSVLADWHPVGPIALHSNLRFDRALSGSDPRAGFLEYSNAVVWRESLRFAPVFEMVGSTNLVSRQTQYVAVPEVIFRVSPSLALKGGLNLGLTSITPTLGLRLQLEYLHPR